MSLRPLLALVCVIAVLLTACGDDTAEPDENAIDPQNEAFNPDPTSDEGFCAHLSPGEIEDATGLGVDEGVVDGDGCTWRLGESAAVIGGPNAGEDARLEARTIDMATFETDRALATDEPALAVEDVDGEAYLVVAEDESDTTLYVADDPSPFTLRLQGGLDDTSANATALSQLAGLIVERN